MPPTGPTFQTNKTLKLNKINCCEDMLAGMAPKPVVNWQHFRFSESHATWFRALKDQPQGRVWKIVQFLNRDGGF